MGFDGYCTKIVTPGEGFIWVLRRASLALITTALLLAGCAFPGSTKPVVKIGLIAPFEGLERGLGYEVLYATKLAIRERNASDGVGGTMMELIALDDSAGPDAAAQAAKMLTVDPKVMGVIGPVSARSADAVADAFDAAGMPWIALAAVPDSTLTAHRPQAFRLFAGPTALADAATDHVVASGAHSVALIRAGDNAFADALASSARARGLAVADSLTLPRDHFDAILFAGDAAAAADFLVELRGAGITVPLVGGPELGRPFLAQRAGAMAEGIVWASSVPPSSKLPPSFVDGYRVLAGAPPGPNAVLAYEATNVLLDQLEFVVRYDSDLSRRGLAAALAAARRLSLVGPIVFDERGAWAAAPVHLYCVTGGDFYVER
jgi:branched-chain amino acid transport system substrate-binding protein